MLSDVCLTSVAYIRSAGGVCGRPAAWRVLADRARFGRPGSRLPLHAYVAGLGGDISWRPPTYSLLSRPWQPYHRSLLRRSNRKVCIALAPLLFHQSSLISIRCHEVTFPSRDNRNQVVYNFIKLRHVTTRLSSIFGSKINQASFHPRRRKSSRTKDTINDINAASIVTHILSFSFCHYATVEALPGNSVYFPGHL